jgi:membrane protease YdiL (CAAX protease family)
MTAIPAPTTQRPSTGLLPYAALACATTWTLAIPAALAWTRREAPAPVAVACAGLSALGPLFAAVAVAGRRKELRQVFGRWRTNPLWVLVALAAPFLAHTVARLVFHTAGGQSVGWIELPRTPEALAALVVFPLGEEFGWRGFAYPRLVGRLGPVRGSLLLGCIWGLWHLAYAVTPAAAGFDPWEFATTMLELPFYSLVLGWMFERANRSMAVALAFHAGAHLDHIERTPHADIRLSLIHIGVVALLALAAARSLSARAPGHKAALLV